MSKPIKKKSRNPGRPGRPRKGTTIKTPPPVDAGILPPSLPLAVRADTTPPTPEALGIDPANPPHWYRPVNGKTHSSVEQILMMRASGMEDADIAAKMGLAQGSLRAYIYLAGKNGWLDFDNAKDHLENLTAHKVLRNIDAMLDGTSLPLDQREVTMEVAKGTLFKKFDVAPVAAPAMNANVLNIRMEVPANTTAAVIREGTTGGTPAWAEGEVVADAVSDGLVRT